MGTNFRMPISALPDETSRLLGSSLTISSPILLVKELLENSIDAGATAVNVLISANTVDRIEVRDNGHGIPTDDFDALGRRAHTSKLRSYEQLKGGQITTLGFRGEALAAASTVGKVSITTRTDNDVVATVLYLHQGHGSAGARGKVSSPVGTTVVVTRLFAGLPVREKFAKQEACLTVVKVKRLLHSYALAKPQLRLTFKVPNHPKLSWSYSPLPGAQLREAILQVFGTELAAQCQEATISSETSGEMNTSPNVVIQACFPSRQSDAIRISHGAFISVDSRPLCSTRGVAKKLLSVYRRHLLSSADTVETRQAREPFLYVSIRCVAGSYDANIEPSKDDILFADETALLRLFETLCQDVRKDAVARIEEDQEGRRPISPLKDQVSLPVSHRPPVAVMLEEHPVCSILPSEAKIVDGPVDGVRVVD